jgi:hypothetical protein
MTNLSQDETRALASLHTLVGYRVLLDKVVKSKREDALTKLKLATAQENIVSAALEFRVWDDVTKTLQDLPAQAVEELKTEGDTIYG